MHDPQFGWDLISLLHQLSWQMKLYMVYLAVVIVFATVRSARLTRQLWFGSSNRRDVKDGVVRNEEKAKAVAEMALANRFLSVDRTMANLDVESHSTVLSMSERRFDYAWEIWSDRVRGLKRTTTLTLLLTLAMFINVLPAAVEWILSYKRFTGLDIAGGLGEPGVVLTFGVFVAALLYGLASFYEGVLVRRKASWNLFLSNAACESDRRSPVNPGE